MVDVICDTNFLIHLATKRIKNFYNLHIDIGEINFVVPTVVKNELEKLEKIQSKNNDILLTLNFIKKLNSICLPGSFADQELINYAKKNKIIIATLDKQLKRQIKHLGSSIISIHNNNIILEN